MENDLSDNQRRLICRSAFLLFCALPTILVTYFATHQRSADDWAKLIQAELGVETRIGAVETPWPGELILKDLKFLNKEFKPVFESLTARVLFGKAKNVAEISNPITVTRDGISYLGTEAASRLIKPVADQSLLSNLKSWDVYIDDLSITDGPGHHDRRFEFSDINICINDAMTGSELKVTESQGRKLSLVRNSGSEYFGHFEAVLEIENQMPCWLASHWFPMLESTLGDDAVFYGNAEIHSHYDIICCRISGDFLGLDIPNSRQIAHIHADRVRLDVNDLRWVDGSAFVVDRTLGRIPLENFTKNRKQEIANPFLEILRVASENLPTVGEQTVKR